MINKDNKTIEEKKSNVKKILIINIKTKIKQLNKKLQETFDEVEEISKLYAKAERELLEKRKIITNLINKVEELEKQLTKQQQQIETKNINKKNHNF